MMNTIFVEHNNKFAELQDAINLNKKGDYIYSYPPRQVYEEISFKEHRNKYFKSLDKFNDLNLYFHIPFCKQICSFCNLFAVATHEEDLIEKYFYLLEKEFVNNLEFISNKKINTLYLGGGTPSAINPKKYEKIINLIDKNLKTQVKDIEEFSMEVSPETVNESNFIEFKSLGLNRINLGFQTINNQELSSIKRKYQSFTLHNSFEVVKKIGFKNICVDLIYGLQNQTIDNWVNSVQSVIDFSPETICIYPLTLRPQTGYYINGMTKTDGTIQYKKYDLAHQLLVSSGYVQETNVRYVKNSGGYLQKANHWKLENVLGFGAGSRSYLWNLDMRNGYSTKFRKNILASYMDKIQAFEHPCVDGFIMDDDERKRKAIILGLINLDRKWYSSIFNSDVLEDFEEEILYLNNLNLLNISEGNIALNLQGIKYRDIIVQIFFSQQVLEKIKKSK